jgi:hypothetical protein
MGCRDASLLQWKASLDWRAQTLYPASPKAQPPHRRLRSTIYLVPVPLPVHPVMLPLNVALFWLFLLLAVFGLFVAVVPKPVPALVAAARLPAVLPADVHIVCLDEVAVLFRPQAPDRSALTGKSGISAAGLEGDVCLGVSVGWRRPLANAQSPSGIFSSRDQLALSPSW